MRDCEFLLPTLRVERCPEGAEGSWTDASVETPVDLRMVKRRIDRVDNPFRLPKHVVVPKSQYAESGGSQKVIASLVVRQARGVLAAIQLDDQLSVE